MSDRRKHRGPGPRDAELFSAERLAEMRVAVRDFSFLLSRGYSASSSLKLVCDRFGLAERQRLAVMRCSGSESQAVCRRQKIVGIDQLDGQNLVVDGFNVLITIEAALSGGYIFKGVDGCLRDISSVHGSYRKICETISALELAGEFFNSIGIANVRWLLDRPVSNSGRLKGIIDELAADNGWPWTVEVIFSPDASLAASDDVVVTSDSDVLDKCLRWADIVGTIVMANAKFPQRIINLAE